jgi:hypothetical protein
MNLYFWLSLETDHCVVLAVDGSRGISVYNSRSRLEALTAECQLSPIGADDC